MLISEESRKDKRWAVLVKPSAVIINKDVQLPIEQLFSISIEQALEVIPEGNTTVMLNRNVTASVKLNYPYKLTTSVGTDGPEVVYFTDAVYNNLTGVTTLTMSAPVTRSYEVGSHIVGGALQTTLASDASSGDAEINFQDNLGLEASTYFVINPGTTTAEVIYVTSFSGTTVQNANNMYFDHKAGEPIQQLDTAKYEVGSEALAYNLTFDSVYGKLPASGGDAQYARIGGGSKKPWIQVGDPASFSEAKKTAIYQAQQLGIQNVRIYRVVDTYDVLYPIS